MLYLLRYRHPHQGVRDDLIEADTFDEAVRIGQAYCAQEETRRYIGVKQAIVADKRIFEQPAPEPEAEPPLPVKVPVADQRETFKQKAQTIQTPERVGA